MRVLRIESGPCAGMEFTFSPVADPQRLPMLPSVSFSGKPPRHMRRHPIDFQARRTLVDHLVSWNITVADKPFPCSRLAAMEVFLWPNLYSAARRELNALLAESE